MKKLSHIIFIFVLSICILPCITAQELPLSVGFVNDFAGVMAAKDKEAVNSLAAAVKEKTGAEIAVVTVKSIAPYAAIEDFSLALAEKWGVGERSKDNYPGYGRARSQDRGRLRT
jgi:uncharacterized protein